MSGLLIILDGMVGCGKTTQKNILLNRCMEEGFSCSYGREPGGSPIAERFRSLILDPQNKGMNPIAEMFAFQTARAEFYAKVVKPTLNEVDLFIMDRSHFATEAFQGYGRGVDLQMIKTCSEYAIQGIYAGLTLFLDVDNIEEALKRARIASGKIGEADRFESEELDFHTKVRDGYRQIAKDNQEKIVLVPSFENIPEIDKRINRISAEIYKEVNVKLNK
jgi:dTMP kinase